MRKPTSFIFAFLMVFFVMASSLALAQNKSGRRQATLAIVGATIYTQPNREPIANGTVVIGDGRIVAVGTNRQVRVPPGAAVINADGLTLLAGFWNSHTHLTTPELEGAATRPVEHLTRQLQAMFTKYGFTTIFDIGSVAENTVALRKRIESGEVAGPKIYTTCGTIFPKDGTPFYLKPLFQQLGIQSPEAASTEQALAMVKGSFDAGADGIKLFTASPTGNRRVAVMELLTVKAITAEAHRRGKPVFAHPQSVGGIDAAIDGGVDILAHAAPDTGEWSRQLIARMKKAGMALMPTLKLWRVGLIQEGQTPEVAEKFQRAGVRQLKAFAATGGEVLFGSDVGYIRDFDTAEEYEQMQNAGMSFHQILASLTSAPARRFGAQKQKGRIAVGMDADLVLVAGDPTSDIRALANVRYTLRQGRLIYDASR